MVDDIKDQLSSQGYTVSPRKEVKENEAMPILEILDWRVGRDEVGDNLP
jgi:hypothetical protein